MSRRRYMKLMGRFNVFTIGLLSALLFIMPSLSLGEIETAIESGQYFSDSLWWWGSDYNRHDTNNYMFYAKPNETLIVRVANESEWYAYAPDCDIYEPGGTNSFTNGIGSLYVNEFTFPSGTNIGWYRIALFRSGGSNSHAYSISFLRMPDEPLSYADTDVGTIRSGESLEGTINVGADLDAAMLSVSNKCTVQIRMGQKDVLLVPDIEIYDPSGQTVTNILPSDYRAEISATLTDTGIYTVVFNDYFNSRGGYAVSMVQIPGEILSTNIAITDLDLGTIISGETLTGTLNLPGDLDPAYYTAVTGDVVKLTMTEVDTDINPVMELYNPSGLLLVKRTDPFQQQVVITNQTMTNGTFTVICKDTEDRYNVSYTLTMELLSGPSTNSFPDAPTGISATDGTYGDHIQVTWNSAGGALGYDLWRSYSTNDYTQISTNYSSTTYDDYDVSTNVVYYYKLKARNDYGTSDFSDKDSGYCGVTVITVDRLALIVGIDHYSSAYPATDLNTCTNDANGMRDTVLLADPSNRWESANITIFTDVQATKNTIRSALNSLASSSGAGDIVVYFQSSHGGQTTNTFLCTYDASYMDTELASDLTLFHDDTTVIVIIDACYSAGLFKNALIPEWPFVKRVMSEFKRIKQAQLKSLGLPVPKTFGENIAFMTACDSDEFSWTSDYYSLYTKYLIWGCSNSTVDANSDNEYEFMELQNYASNEAVQVESQHAQTYNSSLLQTTVARAVGAMVVTVAAGVDNDYDGDGASDLAVYHETTGNWYILSIQNGLIAWDFPWGGPGFMPITGDYDGDGIADPAVYHEDSGQWYIQTVDNEIIAWALYWGGPGLTPVAGDYSGDGVADLAVYDKETGYWYVVTLNGNPLVMGTSWTGSGFLAVPGDYNGDEVSDYAMYHESLGYWYIISADGSYITWGTPWGWSDYTPVTGDFDGDSISDMAVYYEYTGEWFIWSQAQAATIVLGTTWGGSGFTPVHGDYNDDGVSDLAVYHQDTGYWYIQSVDGSETIAMGVNFGGPEFIPILPTW